MFTVNSVLCTEKTYCKLYTVNCKQIRITNYYPTNFFNTFLISIFAGQADMHRPQPVQA